MKFLRLSFFAAALCITGLFMARAQVITHINTDKKLVAITFDACENKHACYFDCAIVDYLVSNKIPATIFLSGKFAYRNREELKKLRKYPFLEFENHSLGHYQHMEDLPVAKFDREIDKNQKMIQWITGRTPKYFRFPAGNYNEKSLMAVEHRGLKVVHWTYASGDPDKSISADRLETEIDTTTRAGDILIFHINGRGCHTAEALPKFIENLRKQGYSFVTVDKLIKEGEVQANSAAATNKKANNQ